jgi:hypothetical protein
LNQNKAFFFYFSAAHLTENPCILLQKTTLNDRFVPPFVNSQQ